MEILVRSRAKQLGLSMYYTGVPCKRGHVSTRHVTNGDCAECKKLRAVQFEKSASRKAKKAKYYLDNKQHIDERNKKYVEANQEKVAARLKRWGDENKDHRSLYNKKWAKANSWIVAAKSRKYQAAKLKRTPAWLTDVDLFEIECVYKYADALRRIGLDYHVDHEIPLQGKLVSGLHVPTNLQVIRAGDNVSKSNKYLV